MSKKNKVPSTPESRAAKLEHSQMVRKVFTNTFLKAFSICLALLLVFSIFYIATVRPNRIELVEPSTDNVVNNNAATPNATPQADGEAVDGAPTVDAPAEITDASSLEEKLAYFNTAINKVKPNAKTITVVKETNSQEGSIEGSIPKSLVSIANTLIDSNMGEKKDLPAPATSVADKNQIFPVENETWASKLTVDDVDSISVTEAGGKYTMVVKVKDDELSTETAHGNCHAGKAMSVITPQTTLDNAGAAQKMLKNVQTGHKNNSITVVIDKATGNVESATYYFQWTLSLEAIGVQISIPFGLKKEIQIAW